jgi:hypothetical protein
MKFKHLMLIHLILILIEVGTVEIEKAVGELVTGKCFHSETIPENMKIKNPMDLPCAVVLYKFHGGYAFVKAAACVAYKHPEQTDAFTGILA